MLEVLARENREGIKGTNTRIDEVLDLLNGGVRTEYQRSVRGRLHKIESTLAGMVLRRNFGSGLAQGWQRFLLAACAIATVAASWYAALAH